jgi:PAB-dependent poly(A)-specific ribonuclease subunit 3
LQMENLHIQNDEVLNELSKETENGRLFRILVKLGMMNERPENDMDPGWSETGDRYLLKLFRDFVFHQVCLSPLLFIPIIISLFCEEYF